MEKQTIDFNRILDWYLNPTTHAEASSTLHRLADFLQDMFEDYFDINFVTVEIMNQHTPNVIDEIKKEFQNEDYFRKMCFKYRTPNDNCIGTNYVTIDGETWDSHPDIGKRLERFDSFVGRHVMSHKAMVPDENNEEMKAYRKACGKVYIGNGQYTERRITWNDEGRRNPEWFIEKEVIDHEWTDELRVVDRKIASQIVSEVEEIRKSYFELDSMDSDENNHL